VGSLVLAHVLLVLLGLKALRAARRRR
jgi:hypothetical protein